MQKGKLIAAVVSRGGGDTTAPTVASFTVATPSSTLIIPVAAFTASEAGASFIITENSTPPAAGAGGWAGTAPTTYTVSANGDYTLYPWVKDAAGNVSSVYGSPASVHVSTILASLVAYWKLDEASGNRADSTGRGNTLAPKVSTGNAAGIISNAASFTGNSNTALHIASNADVVIGDKDFTLDGWFYKTANGYHGIASKSNGTSERDFELYDENDGKLHVRYGGSGTIISTTESIPLSAWNYFMVKRSGTTLSLQLNTGTVYTATITSTAHSQDFALGSRAYAADYQTLNGLVDEVGLWQRALTTNEIAARYNSGVGLTHPF
jgi:hypothetical protein